MSLSNITQVETEEAGQRCPGAGRRCAAAGAGRCAGPDLMGGSASQDVGWQAAQVDAAAAALSAQQACACTTWSHSGQSPSTWPAFPDSI